MLRNFFFILKKKTCFLFDRMDLRSIFVFVLEILTILFHLK